jgi:hypothetical protein
MAMFYLLLYKGSKFVFLLDMVIFEVVKLVVD